MLAEVREQLAGVGSFLLPVGVCGIKLGCQAWQQSPLPAESSLPNIFFNHHSWHISLSS